eukprot:CAMPEP_0170372888 /NCGR_PEP_ID=MMETSP0117_2-20130122/9786_1 /TAXON_ID=400756 /ORGANISM="Durinskia baltica, Strain CSIRO CS-38" /LENGTH=211 /DNA_ID=CAMNT_0010627763 /DNA_START=272 /DNA_END=908 /DNA_ORIENTATION=-
MPAAENLRSPWAAGPDVLRQSPRLVPGIPSYLHEPESAGPPTFHRRQRLETKLRNCECEHLIDQGCRDAAAFGERRSPQYLLQQYSRSRLHDALPQLLNATEHFLEASRIEQRGPPCMAPGHKVRGEAIEWDLRFQLDDFLRDALAERLVTRDSASTSLPQTLNRSVSPSSSAIAFGNELRAHATRRLAQSTTATTVDTRAKPAMPNSAAF